jgi:hypothetical protein
LLALQNGSLATGFDLPAEIVFGVSERLSRQAKSACQYNSIGRAEIEDADRKISMLMRPFAGLKFEMLMQPYFPFA